MEMLTAMVVLNSASYTAKTTMSGNTAGCKSVVAFRFPCLMLSSSCPENNFQGYIYSMKSRAGQNLCSQAVPQE
jgi:hypothetical protein